jgi:hypothetical protein
MWKGISNGMQSVYERSDFLRVLLVDGLREDGVISEDTWGRGGEEQGHGPSASLATLDNSNPNSCRRLEPAMERRWET